MINTKEMIDFLDEKSSTDKWVDKHLKEIKPNENEIDDVTYVLDLIKKGSVRISFSKNIEKYRDILLKIGKKEIPNLVFVGQETK